MQLSGNQRTNLSFQHGSPDPYQGQRPANIDAYGVRGSQRSFVQESLNSDRE